MAERALADKLRGLSRDHPRPEVAMGDASPEREGPSLKDRLERLVAAATRRSREQPAPAVLPLALPLEELIQGRRCENERGEFFLVEDDVHLESLHGDVPLSRFRVLTPRSVGVLSGQPELEGLDLREAVFLDTETTGLAGGAGTAAFLVGLGWMEGERFHLRQYFMRDYHEEGALLFQLGRDLARFRHLVTFNGKSFDVPLLETRFRMNRERYPLAEALHLDLLFPARRLWKARLESCRLQTLERALLGVRRVGDVPGEEIPHIYFDFVRRRDGRAMARVLEHNRLDVISLAALAVLACQWVEGGWAVDPRDVYCLARVLERAQCFERSEEQYRRVVESGGPGVRVAALLRLAGRAKQKGDLESARRLWEEAAAEGDWLALRELALHHEHRSRDLTAALQMVDRGLHLAPHRHGVAADFHRRRQRLLRKLAGVAAKRPGGKPSAAV